MERGTVILLHSELLLADDALPSLPPFLVSVASILISSFPSSPLLFAYSVVDVAIKSYLHAGKSLPHIQYSQ